MRAALLLLPWLAATACSGAGGDTGSWALAGPLLVHDPPAGPLVAGEPVELEVGATDPDGVAEVLLFVRSGDFWTSTPMGEGEGGRWTATVPGEDVREPELAWTFRATDGGDPAAVSELPVGGQDDPFVVEVTAPGASLPFLEDFEGALTGYDPLFSLGWSSVALGFGGQPWVLTETDARSGEAAVTHPRGLEGSDPFDDWLLSPPLDLSAPDRIQVRWYETGAATDGGVDHSLWISTGSRDPRDGDYELVAELDPPPEGSWGRSALVDLSAWSGAASATLAWRYVGADADDWTLDDIEVRELGCDLVLSGEAAPSSLAPGDTITFTWTITNIQDVDCDPLAATLAVPDGAGALQGGDQDLGALAPGATATFVAELALDPAWPDDSYLPVTFEVTDGRETWTDELRPVVGDTTLGHLELELDEAGLVVLGLGVGDPDAPTWEDEVLAEVVDAGTLVLEVDLTDRSAWIPPTGGDGRWFLRIDADPPGRLLDLTLTQGVDAWSAAVLPAWDAGAEAIAYLPEPADPLLVSFTTTPDPVAPGERVQAEVVLRNGGEATGGPVTATVASLDPDLVVLTPGPFALTAAPWGPDEEVTLGSLRFAVDPGHLDSSAVGFEITLDDGVDTYLVPLEIPVPWPVPRVTTIGIDDGDDGLLDPGEAATLELELVNVGDLPTDGTLDATLSVDPGSVVAATLPDPTDLAGTLDPGETTTLRFDVEVDPGAVAGAALALVLDLQDATRTWSLPVSVVLGEAPWIALTPTDDPTGDAHGFTFDLVNGWYRVDVDRLELLLEAAEPPDPLETFVELWGVASSGAYTYYRLVFQSGTAWLQGYDAAFVNLGQVDATWPDDRHLQLAWDLAWMDPALTSLEVGLGAGWCSAETGSYCDHFPDDWGYYYTGYSTYDFFTMRW